MHWISPHKSEPGVMLAARAARLFAPWASMAIRYALGKSSRSSHEMRNPHLALPLWR